MLKGVAVLSALASAAAFAPIATVPRTQRAGPSMQLYKDGKLQGQGVNCIPIFPRPAYLDGTIPGDMVCSPDASVPDPNPKPTPQTVPLLAI